MNSTGLINIIMHYFKMNVSVHGNAKAVLSEGMDIINIMTEALKDNKITMEEKKALTKELREFSKAAIKLIDDIQIPK